MKFGTTTETRTLDNNGSVVNIERKYVNGSVNKPIRRKYEYRTKVTNKKEEFTEYMKFSDSLDDSKLDPGFSIDRTVHGNANGYYFVVKSYTLLDYEDLAPVL